MVVGYDILQDLFGTSWQPSAISSASRPTANPRPVQQFFHAPLRFDSEESAIVFEERCLDQRLPPVDTLVRQQVEAEVRAQRVAILADLPAAVRRLLRKQSIIGDCSMDKVAAMPGTHRRTLDRHLLEHGVRYGELLESVMDDAERVPAPGAP